MSGLGLWVLVADKAFFPDDSREKGADRGDIKALSPQKNQSGPFFLNGFRCVKTSIIVVSVSCIVDNDNDHSSSQLSEH